MGVLHGIPTKDHLCPDEDVVSFTGFGKAEVDVPKDEIRAKADAFEEEIGDPKARNPALPHCFHRPSRASRMAGFGVCTSSYE